MICADGEEVVFVEVKTRTSPAHGLAEEAVHWRKQQRLQRAIAVYLQRHPRLATVRFDVVAVEVFTPKPRIIHYENVELV